ncbi:MAG: glutaredoxin 3 [Comamonadaceae bacterium]|nr:glutaredoxin 3 [Comamonadaceae bacterium]RRD58085.1 glutaredoxin 3 [Comamonadaceae bacterium OH2545_COT-014]
MQPVKMYATATCPYCIRAKQLLKERGVEAIEEIRVDLHPEERVKMAEITGRRTVPQIFIGGAHVGGCDDLVALDQRGALAPMLAGKA